MKSPPYILRPLSEIEEALTITGLAYPLCVVCVLGLDHGPSIQALRNSLDRLQKLHPLLNAVISKGKGRFFFERMNEPVPIPLETEQRKDDLHWLETARKDINLGFDPHKAPLMRVRYLTSETPNGKSEILLTLHHSITDAVSLLHVADQILTFSGERGPDVSILPPIRISDTGLSPRLKEVLPKPFKGQGFWLRLFPFILRQIRDEREYAETNRKVMDTPIPDASDNDLYIVGFSEEETGALIRWTRKNRISMNNIIIAAMVLVMNSKVYGGNKKCMRTVQFANLRPYLQPSVPARLLGSFINLMRISVPVSSGSDIVQLASYLDQQYLKSAKRGDKFLYALLSPVVMKKTIREYQSRLGNIALSYAGSVHLKKQYGIIRLNDFHGFITNNSQGAEISAFGKICFGRLSLNISFLSAETGREKATLILEEIKTLILNSMSEK